MNKFLGCVIAVPIILAIFAIVFAGEMWLVGQALAIFGKEITRGQSIILVMALSLLGGGIGSARASK